MLKSLLIKFWPALIITLVMFLFHSRLFVPQLSIYITPDYGRSDAWHLSIANKFYYAHQLKQNKIPIWNPHIGTGFPTLAEGQTAVFYLPNLIIFRLLPFVWAYNLSLVFSFILAGWGIYLFARSQNLNKFSALFAGVIFPLGGFFVFHVQHHNLLETASIAPWLFWAVNDFLKTKKVFFLAVFSFLLSQQIFTGFPQLVFYSLTGLATFTALEHIFIEKQKAKVYFAIFTAIVLGIVASSVQLLPTYEFLQESTKTTNPQQILDEFPYKFKNLLQFIDPFILGSPKEGNYQRWVPGIWGIFWESQGYVGKIPLALSLSFVPIYLFKKTRKNKNILVFGSLAIIFILLTLGEQSPLRIIYSIEPFSMFRVPSRFLLITQLSLVLLSAFYINKLKSRKVAVAIISLAVLDLFIALQNYNPIGNAQEWFTKPENAIYLENSKSTRIIALGQPQEWNNFFLKGWTSQENLNYFHFARNGLEHNSNLIFNLDQYNAYESIQTKRSAAKNSLLSSQVVSNKIYVPDTTIKLLRSSNVSHIVSPKDLIGKGTKKVNTISVENQNFNVYQILDVQDRVTVVDSVMQAIGKAQITKIIEDPSFDPSKNAITEEDISIDSNPFLKYEIEIGKVTEDKININVVTNKKSVLVISDSYYPGWKAKINEKEVKILPVNINSRGLLLEPGRNRVEVYFKPNTYLIGLIVTLMAHLVLFITILRCKNKTVS